MPRRPSAPSAWCRADGDIDQTATLQEAADAAAQSGTPLFMPPGVYATSKLQLKSGTQIQGVPGRSVLRYRGGGTVLGIDQAKELRLDGLVLDSTGTPLGQDGAQLTATDGEHLDHELPVHRLDRAWRRATACVPSASAIRVPRLRKAALANLFFRKDANSRGNGISIEADTVVSGNVIENAPGFGISVGWGSYLRDVSVTDNLIRNVHIGIGVSIDRSAGTALITDNLISGAKDGAIRAMNGPTPTGPDLARESAEAFPNLAVYSNVAR